MTNPSTWPSSKKIPRSNQESKKARECLRKAHASHNVMIGHKKIEKKEKKMNPVSEIYERSFTGTNVLKIRINEKHSLAIGGVLQHVGKKTIVQE